MNIQTNLHVSLHCLDMAHTACGDGHFLRRKIRSRAAQMFFFFFSPSRPSRSGRRRIVLRFLRVMKHQTGNKCSEINLEFYVAPHLLISSNLHPAPPPVQTLWKLRRQGKDGSIFVLCISAQASSANLSTFISLRKGFFLLDSIRRVVGRVALLSQA